MKIIRPIDVSKYSGEEADRLWQNIRNEQYAFDDLTRGRPDLFLGQILTPGTEHFEVGDSGYACATGIQPPVNAMVHFALWKPMKPAELRAAGRELLGYLFQRYQLRRVTGLIPELNIRAKRFANLMHFRFEGDMRQAFLFNGRYANLQIYGLLRTEFQRSEETCLREQPSAPLLPRESEPVAP